MQTTVRTWSVSAVPWMEIHRMLILRCFKNTVTNWTSEWIHEVSKLSSDAFKGMKKSVPATGNNRIPC